ncbi:MAG: hypothetical protein M1838_000470 [Thelocarpon superellum]|nr:MAG: hypothetical protein M1838_000470 [Thelocarpon superellum]
MASLGGSAIPSVSVEQDADMSSGGDVHIKPDPDSVDASPLPLSEDDIYEDAGDLDFSHFDKAVYLMRVPKYLWENWSKLGDDEQIKVGQVRVERLGHDANGQEINKFTMLLAPSAETKRGLPREYDMKLTNADSTNTYIFTEKDLPGYRSRGQGSLKNSTYGGVSKGPTNQSAAGKDRPPGAGRWERAPRGQPRYKRAIPKHTALAGLVKHEMSCVPLDLEQERRYVDGKAKASSKPRETVFLEGVGPVAGNLLDPGTLGSGSNFRSFIKTNRGPQRGKPQETKNARIPQNELFDLIYECFSRYNYWPFKTLKRELNQPDQYLKETLEVVADLVKSGRFAMTWTLKPANRVAQYADIKDEVAPEAADALEGASDVGEAGGDAGAGDDDDDDDDMKMEDVMPT